MKDEMREAEARIDRVLRGLGEAQPGYAEGSAGEFERRVLRAVQERAAGGKQSKRRGLATLGVAALGVRRWRFAVAAAVLVLAALLWAGHAHRMRQGTAATVARVQSPPAAAPVRQPAENAAVGAVASLGEHRAHPASARAVGVPRVERPARMVAIGNHPAPEAPLTDEERLLLRIAHRGQPDQYAALNPDARDAVAMTEKQEFRQFFGPPPTGDSE